MLKEAWSTKLETEYIWYSEILYNLSKISSVFSIQCRTRIMELKKEIRREFDFKYEKNSVLCYKQEYKDQTREKLKPEE